MTNHDSTEASSAARVLFKALLLPIPLVFFSSVATTVLVMIPFWLALIVCMAPIVIGVIFVHSQNLRIQKSLIVSVLILGFTWLASIICVSRVGTTTFLPSITAFFAIVGALTVVWMLPRTKRKKGCTRSEITTWAIVFSAFVLCLLTLSNIEVTFDMVTTSMLRMWELFISLAVMAAIAAYSIRWPYVHNASSSDTLLSILSVGVFATVSTFFSLSAFFSFVNADLAACKIELMMSHGDIEKLETAIRKKKRKGISGKGVDELQKQLEYSRLLQSVVRVLDQSSDFIVDENLEETLRGKIAGALLPVASLSFPSLEDDVAKKDDGARFPLTLANLWLMNSHGKVIWEGVGNLPSLALPGDSVQKNATEILEESCKFVLSANRGPSKKEDSETTAPESPDTKASDADSATPDLKIQKFLTSPKYGQRALAEIGAFLTMESAPNGYWTRYLHTTVRGPIQYVTIIVFWTSFLPAVSFILLLIRDSRNITWLKQELVIFHRVKRIKHAVYSNNSQEASTSLDFPTFGLRIEDPKIWTPNFVRCLKDDSSPSLELPSQEISSDKLPSDVQCIHTGDGKYNIQLALDGKSFDLGEVTVDQAEITGAKKHEDSNLEALNASRLDWASDWLEYQLNSAAKDAKGEFTFVVRQEPELTIFSLLVEVLQDPSTKKHSVHGSIKWHEQERESLVEQLRVKALAITKCTFSQAGKEINGRTTLATTDAGVAENSLSLQWDFPNGTEVLKISNITLDLKLVPRIDLSRANIDNDDLKTICIRCLKLDEILTFPDHLEITTDWNSENCLADVRLMLPRTKDFSDEVDLPVALLRIKSTSESGIAKLLVTLEDHSSAAKTFAKFYGSLKQSDTAPFGLIAVVEQNVTKLERPSIKFSRPRTGEHVLTVCGITAPRSAKEEVRFDDLSVIEGKADFIKYLCSEYSISKVDLKVVIEKEEKEEKEGGEDDKKGDNKNNVLRFDILESDDTESSSAIASFRMKVLSEAVVYDQQLYKNLQDVYVALSKYSDSQDTEELHACSLVTRVLNGACIMGTREAMYDVLEQGCNELDERTDLRMELVRYGAWLAPSFGFIGTIYGIGSALLGSEKMVTADEASQGSEISAVSQTLGSAFDTTMVALILSMGLVFLIHIATYLTSNLIITFRRFANDNLIELFEGPVVDSKNGGNK